LTGKLAFEDGPGGTLYVYDLQSRSLWPIAQEGYDPAISPDGTKVALMAQTSVKFLVSEKNSVRQSGVLMVNGSSSAEMQVSITAVILALASVYWTIHLIHF